jgi:hypothetical protein
MIRSSVKFKRVVFALLLCITSSHVLSALSCEPIVWWGIRIGLLVNCFYCLTTKCMHYKYDKSLMGVLPCNSNLVFHKSFEYDPVFNNMRYGMGTLVLMGLLYEMHQRACIQKPAITDNKESLFNKR